MTARKSERLFLIEGPLPPLAGTSGTMIAQGCLSHERTKEVWLVRRGRSCGVAVLGETKGGGLCEPNPVPKETFEALWGMTESHSVQILRHQLEYAGSTIEIDIFQDHHAPMATARVRFPSAAVAHRFKKPGYFGREIPPTHTLREIALHGIPRSFEADVQAGAVPFLFKKGLLHIVLITSSSGTKWLIPKGRMESGMTPEEVALMEAAEEAGAIGTIERGCRAQCTTDDGRTLELFPLRVATLLPHWPERFARRRVVLPVYRALLRISDPSLARALRDLSRHLTH